MIYQLLIKQSPIFNDLILTPSKGFNVFSGASGSGKSVLMDSILALFGVKDSNANLIEGIFKNDNLKFEDFIIQDNDDLVVKILKNDKTKYLLNDQHISRKRIKDYFSSYLKYINSISVDELNNSSLLHILDSIIIRNDKQYSKIINDFNDLYKMFVNKNTELNELNAKQNNINDLIEFAEFEINQIESINPKVNEYEELLDIKKALSFKEKNLEKIQFINKIIQEFYEIFNFLDSIDKNKPIFEDSINEIEAIIREEEERLLNIDYDIEEVLNRLESISKLIHKYGSIELAQEYLEKKKIDLENYRKLNFNKKTLENELKSIKIDLDELIKSILSYRKKYIINFNSRLEFYCNSLMLPPPLIKLTNNSNLDSNAGITLDIVIKDSNISTLSSGEFNRLKLALLCVLVEQGKQEGIIILDEIDANLSGSESEAVARILSFLSDDYQIFAISHQPHMSIFADNHYLVRQESNDKVLLLDKEGRINEIARIISGEHITREAILFARDKLKHL